MKLNKLIEKKLKKEVIKILNHGKPGWDVPHTINSVKWIRELIKEEGGNEKILVPAIYLHDAGYPALKKGYNFNEMMASKIDHAETAAKNAKIILKNLDFTKKEIEEIVYLVKNHDKHNNIKTKNRQLVFEADGLAQINWYVVAPNFDKKNTIKFFNYFKKERVPNIKTKTGKKYINQILKKGEEYLKNWPN